MSINERICVYIYKMLFGYLLVSAHSTVYLLLVHQFAGLFVYLISCFKNYRKTFTEYYYHFSRPPKLEQ